jgi:hypothetical protein
MHFDGDAFISYAHLDNQELIEGRKGWVANLHRALEIRVGQLLGKPPQIWRDPKLQGNDFFADTLIERLKRVAVLVAIVSPRYTRSEWTRKELQEFWKAAETQGGVRFAEKARIFKVLKTPVPLDQQQPELKGLLGYEFFRLDPETGRVRELDDVFGAEAQREFWIKLDDLAHEMCALLERLEGEDLGRPSNEGLGSVYLAEATSDLREQRDVIRRDLLQMGYTVLPVEPLPHVAEDVAAAVRTSLSNCLLSVHLLGKTYGLVPEGGSKSLVEIQNELAIERGREGKFSRLLWIPERLDVTDPRQRAVLDRIRTDPRIDDRSDVLETFLEDFRSQLQERLERPRTPPAVPAADAAAGSGTPGPQPAGRTPTVYLMYDRRDSDAAAAWADRLFEQHVEVLHPLFDGDETEIREYHDENLRTCDGVIIFFGVANEACVRRKMRELQKAAGYGRTLPAPALAICVLEPRTPEKDRFRTHEGTVLHAWTAGAVDSLGPFVARVRAGDKGTSV